MKAWNLWDHCKLKWISPFRAKSTSTSKCEYCDAKSTLYVDQETVFENSIV